MKYFVQLSKPFTVWRQVEAESEQDARFKANSLDFGIDDVFEESDRPVSRLKTLTQDEWLDWHSSSSLDRFRFCAGCGAELVIDLARIALARFEQSTCSTDCSKRQLIKRMGCCEKAEMTPCVCAYSFKCPEHGEKHIGTHD